MIYEDREYRIVDDTASELRGATIKGISGLIKYSDGLILETDKGSHLIAHDQDCCETVRLIDWEFSSSELIGAEIYSLDSVTEEFEGDDALSMWTFVTLKTSKGELWMRWVGESNGCYSVDVDLMKRVEM